jgi:hypothetical protein
MALFSVIFLHRKLAVFFADTCADKDTTTQAISLFAHSSYSISIVTSRAYRSLLYVNLCSITK